MVVKALLTNWIFFSVICWEVISCLMNQLFKNFVDLWVDLISALGIPLVRLENKTVIMTIFCFEFLVLGSILRTSKAMNFSSVQLERARVSAFASFDIHSGRVGITLAWVCTHVSPDAAILGVVPLCHVYATPWRVLLLLASVISTRYWDVVWQRQCFEGRHQFEPSLWGCCGGQRNRMRRGTRLSRLLAIRRSRLAL